MDTTRTTYRRIGELADAVGMRPKTIRYYEEIGLLPPPRRTSSGYRVYDADDRERLRFIARAKALGLTLGEIGEILRLRRDGCQPCDRVTELLDRKLEALEAQLRLLEAFRSDLLALRNEAAQGTPTSARFCWIIERQDESAHHDPAR